MARPGIMLYFDMLEPIRVLPDADKGRLLVAMLEYGKDGTLPKFDGMLALAWGFVQPKLDRDDESYENAMQQRKYAGFCKSRASRNLPKISFEEWSMMDEETRKRAVSGDIGPMLPISDGIGSHPTTITTASTSTTTKTMSTAAAAATGTTNTSGDGFAAATAERDPDIKFVGGELGKGVVLLSQEQVESLLDRMGIDAFDYYVDKLSSFIIKNDAKVKNHYETILKWWQEDGAVHKRKKPPDEIPKGATGKLGQAELEAIERLFSGE